MRAGKLFASILAGIAAMSGVASTTSTDTPRQISQSQVEQQRNDTRTPATAPTANTVQNLRAGATIVPLSIPRVFAAPRWAWVGRKVGGRFDFYCRRVGA